jgi:hypothetical protein
MEETTVEVTVGLMVETAGAIEQRPLATRSSDHER